MTQGDDAGINAIYITNPVENNLKNAIYATNAT